MSNTKHTPGPWRTGLITFYGPNGMAFDFCCIEQEGDRLIGAFAATAIPSFEDGLLIAAAHDLLAVCQDTIELSDRDLEKQRRNHPEDPRYGRRNAEAQAMYDRMVSIIAKATGSAS